MSDIAKDELVGRLSEEGLVLLDVRSADEFTGVLGAPCDPRQGHIPGARNVELQSLFGLAPDEVRALVGAEAGAEVIAYCHSGSRSALAVQLLRVAGYDARNYVGSWHEWARDPDLGVES